MFLQPQKLQCGVFSSSVQRSNQSTSQPRTVEKYELELFISDGGVSHVNGNDYPIKKGMVLCAVPGDKRYSDFPIRCSFIRILPREDENELERVIRSLPQSFYIRDEKAFTQMQALFAKLSSINIGTQSSKEDVDVLRIHSLLYEVICRLYKLGVGDGESEKLALSSPIREAHEYISEHFADDCSLADIARAVHLSPNYLHTAFSAQVGLTPFEYKTQLQLEKAKKLIAAGERSLIDIALESGFCSQSHFNKVFKGRFGITPAKYRKNISYEY